MSVYYSSFDHSNTMQWYNHCSVKEMECIYPFIARVTNRYNKNNATTFGLYEIIAATHNHGNIIIILIPVTIIEQETTKRPPRWISAKIIQIRFDSLR